MSQRIQQAWQKRRTHPRRVLDDWVCELRLVLFAAREPRNQFKPILLRDETEINCFVVTGVSRDLFYEIFFLFDVDAPRRNFETHAAIRLSCGFEPEPRQYSNHLVSLN